MTSESSNPLDAYQPPKPIEGEAGPVVQKTGRIKAICIIAIVLGGLGLFSAFAGTASLLFGKQIQSAMSPPNQPGVNQEMIEEMQNDQQAVLDRFFGINVVLVVLLGLVAFALVVGGVQCLRRVPPARKILLAACSAALLYEVVRTIRDVIIQAQMIPMSLQHTERMMSASDGPPGVTDFAMTARGRCRCYRVRSGLGLGQAGVLQYLGLVSSQTGSLCLPGRSRCGPAV